MSTNVVSRVVQAITLIGTGITETEARDVHNLSWQDWQRYVKRPPLDAMLSEALAVGHDCLADALLTIDRHPRYGHADAKMASVISKNLQWFLERKARDAYGPKVVVELQADREVLAALGAAKRRAQALLPDRTDVLDLNVLSPEDEEIAEALLAASLY